MNAVIDTTVAGPAPVDLARLLPLVRWMRAAGSSSGDTEHDVFVLHEGGIVLYRKRGSQAIPPLAFEPNGLGMLRSAPSIGAKVEIAKGDVASVEISPLHLYGSATFSGRELGVQVRIWLIDGRYAEAWLPQSDAKLVVVGLSAMFGPRVRRDAVLVSRPQGTRIGPPARSTMLRVLAGMVVAAIAGVALSQSVHWGELSTFLIPVVSIFMLAVPAFIGVIFVIGNAVLQPPTRLAEEARKAARRALSVRAASRAPRRAPGLAGSLKIVGSVFVIIGVLIQLGLGAKFGAAANLFGWAALWPAAALLLYAYRLGLPSAETVLASDRRSPVVYLRSFEHDDTDSYNPTTFSSRALGLQPLLPKVLGPLSNPLLGRMVRLTLGHPEDTAEEQLSRAFKGIGPLVAIGRPGEALATGGAARLYVGDTGWRDVALQLICSASTVIIEAGGSDGLWWEIGEAARIARSKILLSVRGCEGSQSLYDDFRLRFEPLVGFSLPRAVEAVGFVGLTDAGSLACPLSFRSAFTWPIHGCAVDFERTLATYFSVRRGAYAPSGLIMPAPGGVEGLFAVFAWNVFLPNVLGAFLAILFRL